jgi:isopenicillin-N N-acyltransferase-like protein
MNSMFSIITLPRSADAFTRGQIYGKTAASRIRHSVLTYAKLFACCGIDWQEACERARRYAPAITALDAGLMAEMQGIAQGSGWRLDDILALNCRTEILPSNFLSDVTFQAEAALEANRLAGLPDWETGLPIDPHIQEGECTAMCVQGHVSIDGHTWFAQNWDWIGRQRQALVLLKTHDAQGRALVTLTEAGMLAKIGMNAAGFALGLNILRSSDDGQIPGVPVHIVLRHLLNCDSIAHARDRMAHMAGMGFGAASNVPCADALGEVACFELAPAGWAELQPTNGVVLHTNHFLCDALRANQSPMGPALSSQPRLATAEKHAAQPGLGLERLQSFLRDESDGFLSICRSPDPALAPQGRVESVAGIVMNTHTRQIWIAPDVPSRVEFEEITNLWA